MTNKIEYRTEKPADVDAVIDLYIASTLGVRRPIEKRENMAQMLDEANLILTAWDGDLLVGIARSFTDWCYIAYLADLAIRESHQHQGIGKELIRRSQSELSKQATIILIAAPAAEGYYPKIGMKAHHSAWVLRPGDTLSPEK